MPSAEQAVLAANDAFYQALQSRDLEQMSAMWWHDEWVQCLHPGWQLIRGWDEIRESWAGIFRSTSELSIMVSRPLAHVLGDAAWISCIEQVTTSLEGEFATARVETTNIFAKREGQWKLVHHHTTPLTGTGLVEVSRSVH